MMVINVKKIDNIISPPILKKKKNKMSPLTDNNYNLMCSRSLATSPSDHEQSDDDDCRSVRSLPLLHDDDYFYYHGVVTACEEKRNSSDDGDGSDDDEQVDHVSRALISPHQAIKIETRSSLGNKSVCSELSFDDYGFDDEEEHYARPQEDNNQKVRNRKGNNSVSRDNDDGDDNSVCIQDFISLKVRVAELESQLQLQRRNDTLQNLLENLQDQNLSLECEKIRISQKLNQTQESLVKERSDARQVQTYMQEKISRLKKQVDVFTDKNKMLQGENLRLKQQRRQARELNGLASSLTRRSTTGGIANPYPEVIEDAVKVKDPAKAFVPFPNRSRRHSVAEKPPKRKMLISSIASSRETALATSSSLLEVLRCSFQSSLSGSGPPALEFSETSRSTTRTAAESSSSKNASSESFPREHDSWAATDEINTQTELFNRQSKARLMAMKKQQQQESISVMSMVRETNQLSQSDNTDRRTALLTRGAYSERHIIASTTTSSGALMNKRPKLKRRKSFTLGDSLRSLSMKSLCEMDSGSDDEEFDANSVLWDSDNDEEEDEVDECDGSVGTVRSIRSVAF